MILLFMCGVWLTKSSVIMLHYKNPNIVMVIFIINHCKDTIILLGWVQIPLAYQNYSSFLQSNSFSFISRFPCLL